MVIVIGSQCVILLEIGWLEYTKTRVPMALFNNALDWFHSRLDGQIYGQSSRQSWIHLESIMIYRYMSLSSLSDKC